VWLFAGWLASRLGWKAEGGDPGALRFRSGTGPVTLTLKGTGAGEERVLERIRIQSGEPPLEMEILHHGRDHTAQVRMRAPRESSSEVPFGYCELASCIVGEIHRHAANRTMEEAARAAEEMMGHWRKV
jgi:glucose-6-phosphate dehydrogenase assembly protein OpcA